MTKEKRLLLVNPGFPGSFEPSVPLGLMAVAAQVPPNLLVELRDEQIQRLTDKDFADMENAFVGITAMTAQAKRAKEIANEARRAGAIVFIGGIHSTVTNDFQLYPQVKGEVEGGSLFRALQDYLTGKQLESCYYAPPIANLLNLPLPRSSIFQSIERYQNQVISASRGCYPGDCDYCSVSLATGEEDGRPNRIGNKIRRRPVNEIIRELELRGLLEAGVDKTVAFADDNFINVPLLSAIKAKIRDKPFPWLAQVTLDTFANDNFLTIANSLGTPRLAVGVESPFRERLKEIKKTTGNRDPVAVFQHVREKYPKIRTWLLLMVGFDFDPPDVFEQYLRFIELTLPDVVYLSILTPLPGTKIARQLYEQGRIFDFNTDHYGTKDLTYYPKRTKSDGSIVEISPKVFIREFIQARTEISKIVHKWSRVDIVLR